MASDGTFIVHSGGADIGTGLDTVVNKLVAEVLCCPLDNITIHSGDTDHAPFDKGAYASSGTCFSGNAARLAAEAMKEKILKCGAEMLGVEVYKVELVAPGIVRCQHHDQKVGEVSFFDIAHKAESGTGWGQLLASGCFTTLNLPSHMVLTSLKWQ